ncbi:MAG TPA: Stk1 family PASTA domain-containing Ser/Thr kinase [Microbacteriaceae bacterium]|nr:Stk1 family PASTA domain-containing Ser/Thr kinase [Microbacteriaceae bacterium]
MTTAASDPMIGRLVDGRYRVRSRIARGGMATVYLATDLRLERQVAIKVMHSFLADDAALKDRFVQEARSAARLAHPNVVNVFDQGQDDDMAYLVMEYLPGITLRDLLRERGRLTGAQAVGIGVAVLSGLAAAHRAGIIHRDLKPENVLLCDDGRIKIGDFGLARAASAATASGQLLLGTIAYLSPELVTRGVADTRSDIYAMGIMLYEMLTGEQPFHGEEPVQIAYQHANDSVPPPSLANPAVSPELDELVLWATAKSPDARPADAQVLLDQLSDIGSTTSGEVSPQATLVLPDAGATAVLTAPIAAPGRLRGRPAIPGSSGNRASGVFGPGAVLAKRASRRKLRGWWVFVLVVVLAAASGGAGWYFGSGPGAFVSLPGLAGASPTRATAALTRLGLDVGQRTEHSLRVTRGTVIATSPRAGTDVRRGSKVVLRVSSGPAPVTLPKLAGMTAAQATKALAALNVTVLPDRDEVFDKTQAGTVLQARMGARDVSAGGAAHEGEKVALVVSLGPVPDVVGESESAASGALNAAGLEVGPESNSYSDTVPKDHVISAAPASNPPLHKGDAIILTISKGPQQVPVPDVTGMSIKDAEKTLAQAGFHVNVKTNVPKPLWSVIDPVSTDPPAGTPVDKGAKVTINAQY